MRRDVTYLTAGGSRRQSLQGLSRWLAIGLGGALVLALVLAQVVRANSHASLASLTLSGIELEFDSNKIEYEVTVPYGTDKTTVSATPTDADATVTIDPSDDDGGTPGHQVKLAEPVEQAVDSDTVIKVTVMRGPTTSAYTVTVTRIAAYNAELTKLALSDVTLETGDLSMTMYTASVPNDLDPDTDAIDIQTTVTAEAVAGARVLSITPPDANGSMSGHQVDLTGVGNATTTIIVTVLAADEQTRGKYEVVVTRTRVRRHDTPVAAPKRDHVGARLQG